MKVEAIYDHGKLEFVEPLQLKHERIRLVVTVPDDEVELQTKTPFNLPIEIVERARMMRERLDAIRNAHLPPDDQLPDLTEKQLERIAAFELRDDR